MKRPAEWIATIARLKRELPLPHPVAVRTVSSLPDNRLGDCVLEDGQFRIRILRERDWVMWDVLAHEWAHCLDQWHDERQDPHSDVWGVHFARAYRVIHDEDRE